MKKFFKMFGAAGLLAGMMMLGGCGGDSSVPYGTNGVGYVVKGPVAGAKVTYSNGATVLSSTVNGSFLYDGLAVTTSGGTYTDLAGTTTRKAPPMAGLAYKANVTPLTTIYAAASAADQAKLQTLVGAANSIDTATLGGRYITGAVNIQIAKLNETIGEVLTQITEQGLVATPAYLANIATIVGNNVMGITSASVAGTAAVFNADGTIKTAGTGLNGLAAYIVEAVGSPFVVDATYTTLGAKRAYLAGLACAMGARAIEGAYVPLPTSTPTPNPTVTTTVAGTLVPSSGAPGSVATVTVAAATPVTNPSGGTTAIIPAATTVTLLTQVGTTLVPVTATSATLNFVTTTPYNGTTTGVTVPTAYTSLSSSNGAVDISIAGASGFTLSGTGATVNIPWVGTAPTVTTGIKVVAVKPNGTTVNYTGTYVSGNVVVTGVTNFCWFLINPTFTTPTGTTGGN